MLRGTPFLLVRVTLLALCCKGYAWTDRTADSAEEPLAVVLFSGQSVKKTTEVQSAFDSFIVNQKYYGDDPGRGSSHDGFLLGRFRAGLDWQPSEKIHLALWGQNSEAWDTALPDSQFYQGDFRTINHPNKDRWELYTSMPPETKILMTVTMKPFRGHSQPAIKYTGV